jgi:hypothetical protein
VGRLNLLELTLAPSFNICDTPGAFGTCNAIFAVNIALIQYSFKVKTNFLEFGYKTARTLSSTKHPPTTSEMATMDHSDSDYAPWWLKFLYLDTTQLPHGSYQLR